MCTAILIVGLRWPTGLGRPGCITEDNLCGCMHYTATDVQFGREWDRLRSDVNAVAAACATLTANRRSDGLKNVRALRKSTWPNGMAYRLQTELTAVRDTVSPLSRERYMQHTLQSGYMYLRCVRIERRFRSLRALNLYTDYCKSVTHALNIETQ